MVNHQDFCVRIPQTHEENCGSQNMACCSDDGCNAQNLVCVMKTCVACGELNNPTCLSADSRLAPPGHTVTRLAAAPDCPKLIYECVASEINISPLIRPRYLTLDAQFG